MQTDLQIVKELYDQFNARDMPAVLSKLAEDVTWANGMEGTHIHGPDAVREYWTYQWSIISPHVEPVHISQASDGSIVVEVHQVVRDLKGEVLIDENVRHVFVVEDGRVKRFDIESDTRLSTMLHERP